MVPRSARGSGFTALSTRTGRPRTRTIPFPDPRGVVNALIENGVECQPNQNGDERRHVVAMHSMADWSRDDIV